jgi:hypothetical protein
MLTVNLIAESERFPADERFVFREHYLLGRDSADICAERGWTQEEFNLQNERMLRMLREPISEVDHAA